MRGSGKAPLLSVMCSLKASHFGVEGVLCKYLQSRIREMSLHAKAKPCTPGVASSLGRSASTFSHAAASGHGEWSRAW
jgi:hypothetical protein